MRRKVFWPDWHLSAEAEWQQEQHVCQLSYRHCTRRMCKCSLWFVPQEKPRGSQAAGGAQPKSDGVWWKYESDCLALECYVFETCRTQWLLQEPSQMRWIWVESVLICVCAWKLFFCKYQNGDFNNNFLSILWMWLSLYKRKRTLLGVVLKTLLSFLTVDT